jgi:hypothetical protein
MSSVSPQNAGLTLALTEEERQELVTLLEQALSDTRVAVHRTHTPGYREDVIHQEKVLRALLEKVRGLQRS